MSWYLPSPSVALIPSTVLVIFDSVNLAISFNWNVLSFRYTIPNLLAPPEEGVDPLFVTTLAIALELSPTISSPIIAFDATAAVALNVIISKVGCSSLVDSRIAIIFETSGTFKDISLSWTLKPYAYGFQVNPSWIPVPIPDCCNLDAVISIILLLTKFLTLLWIPCLIAVTLTTVSESVAFNPPITTWDPPVLYEKLPGFTPATPLPDP